MSNHIVTLSHRNSYRIFRRGCRTHYICSKNDNKRFWSEPISNAFLSSFHTIRKTYVFIFFAEWIPSENLWGVRHAFWSASNIASNIVIVIIYFRFSKTFDNVYIHTSLGWKNCFSEADAVRLTSLWYPISITAYIFVDLHVVTSIVYILWNIHNKCILKPFRYLYQHEIKLKAWSEATRVWRELRRFHWTIFKAHKDFNGNVIENFSVYCSFSKLQKVG